MMTDIRGMTRQVSAAALSVTRLAEAANPEKCAAWARKGPATAPRRAAAASPVRNTALTRPRTALGITRCMAVWPITSHIEPNMPTATAAKQEPGVPAAVQPLHPQRDEHGAERRIGAQEDDGDGKQCPCDGLVAQDAHALDEVAGRFAHRELVVRVLPVRAGGQHHRGSGQQVAEGVSADQPFDSVDGQQDSAEGAADLPDCAVGAGVERVGATQQRPGAHDGRRAGLPGWHVQHAAAALRDVEYPVPYPQSLEHDRRLSLIILSE